MKVYHGGGGIHGGPEPTHYVGTRQDGRQALHSWFASRYYDSLRIWHPNEEDEILRDFPYLGEGRLPSVYEFFASIPERIAVLEASR